MSLTKKQLHKVLVEPGHISEDAFVASFQHAHEHAISPEQAIIDTAPIAREHLGQAIAYGYGVPFVSLQGVHISKELLALIPESVARSQRVTFFELSDTEAKLATAAPDNYECINMLAKKVDRIIKVYYALPHDTTVALRGYQGTLSEQVETFVTGFAADADTVTNKDDHAGKAVAFVDKILSFAFEAGASDIHLQPLAKDANIRLRVDGILETHATYPKELHEKVTSRIRILAHLRTDEPGIPQDGRFTYTCNDQSFDLRVSIAPITGGDNVVMRLLRQETRTLTLEEIGLTGRDLQQVQRAAQRSHGMLLAVGPTGSGKTTTLYTMIKTLDRKEKNIMTIEDPVEYNIEYVQQMQVNDTKELLFSNGLRTVVRQDPDVIMVGEIRDSEAADIAVNAAMTGHLLLSTLHTNDAATTFPRLAEMGVETFLVASSVNVIIAQRLVRKICSECRVSVTADEYLQSVLASVPDVLQELFAQSDKKILDDITLFHGAGCATCNGVGFRGRTGTFEVLEVTDEIRQLIIANAPAAEITACAKRQGMTTIMQDGVQKVLQGITSIEEVLRVIRS